MFILAIVLLIVVAMYSCFRVITPKPISYKECSRVSLLFIAGAALLAFHFHPTRLGVIEADYASEYWDISRYYIEMQDISRRSFSHVIALSTTINEPLRFPFWYLLSLLPSLEVFQMLSVLVACVVVFYYILKNEDLCQQNGLISDLDTIIEVAVHMSH